MSTVAAALAGFRSHLLFLRREYTPMQPAMWINRIRYICEICEDVVFCLSCCLVVCIVVVQFSFLHQVKIAWSQIHFSQANVCPKIESHKKNAKKMQISSQNRKRASFEAYTWFCVLSSWCTKLQSGLVPIPQPLAKFCCLFLASLKISLQSVRSTC